MSVLSYLIVMAAGAFWLFRVIVAFTYSIGANFITTPIDLTTEIILLFVVMFSFIFIIKRNIFGALIYFGGYGWYFGTFLYNGIISGGQDGFSMFIAIVGILISILLLLDILFNKNGKKMAGDKEGWFYKGKEYDRKIDERADENQYKFR